MTTVCMTIDVEDFYDGMAELGEAIERPVAARSGLTGLASLLGPSGVSAVTLFVVGNYADRVHADLAGLIADGHEVACHGPDHGRLPEDPKELLQWLRRGREMVEDLFQTEVVGFRSPRFDVPKTVGLDRYRNLLAEAGYGYVSDRSLLGDRSPVRELPVLTRYHYPVGGGSYQRMLPAAAVNAAVGTSPEPVVLYYHSYDFGATLPGLSSIRSVALAKQLIGRPRVAGLFSTLLDRYGSETCSHVT
jgi:peptidoglycan/xylan/chitin deacetylase (PgdA/CDA1 family)